MKTFKEFIKLAEMADPTGINVSNNLSKEDTYNTLIKLKEKFNTISDNVGNNKYEILEYNGTYYLIDKETKEYLGNIETKAITIKGSKALVITTSYSNGKAKGMYGMMFTHIFKDTDIKYIFGDKAQSTQAIESWRKIIKSFDGVVLDTDTMVISKYDDSKRDEYWARGSYNIRVGITIDKDIVERCFTVNIDRAINDNIDGVFRRIYETRDTAFDSYLYSWDRMSLS